MSLFHTAYTCYKCVCYWQKNNFADSNIVRVKNIQISTCSWWCLLTATSAIDPISMGSVVNSRFVNVQLTQKWKFNLLRLSTGSFYLKGITCTCMYVIYDRNTDYSETKSLRCIGNNNNNNNYNNNISSRFTHIVTQNITMLCILLTQSRPDWRWIKRLAFWYHAL